MIRGTVNARNEAIVRIRLRGLTGIEDDIDFLIDTGFDDTVVLPESVAVRLGFFHMGSGPAILADGSLERVEIYLGQIFWKGAFEDIALNCIGGEGLIGTGLLNGHELRVEVTPGGMVEVKELP